MIKYVKVMFGTTSGAKSDFKYKLNEINVANNWNPKATNGKDFGGFNYCSEECILRWLHRGDTIYDVEIPADAENIRLDGATTIYRTNKIIISNPRKVDDELALHFYKISKIPEKSYYKALGVVSIMNYKQTAYRIFRDKVNKDNMDIVLEEWNDFISHGNKNDRKDVNDLTREIETYLDEIKSELLISRFVDKEPYIKDITNDKVINITGESGSGKSTYTKKYLNDDKYIVIDTDEIIKDRPTDNKNCIEFREFLKKKYNDSIPDICNEFSTIYNDILDYYKNTDKTLVIDSAQFRNLRTEKEINLLKGKIIIIRTSIEECYKRVINRWKEINKKYTEEELDKYKNKKVRMFEWYKSLNDFIENIDKLDDKRIMNREDYIEKLNVIFGDNENAKEVFTEQINNYYNARENCKAVGHNYKVGDMVKLEKHQLMRGEGAIAELNEDKIKFISENGFISPDFIRELNLRQKTPLTIPVWNIQQDILLKDYIALYSGATFLYTVKSENYNKHTFLAPYGEVENKINEFYDKDIWMWQCEQTKEIRFMPSLARDNMQLAFIMNLSNEFGKSLVKNDIFNLSFDKNALGGFISSEFIDKFIYADRDDFTTNRESAIIFGIPSCFIEGLLVGRRYEHDNEQLNLLKKYFPNCYICNLDGVVINI